MGCKRLVEVCSDLRPAQKILRARNAHAFALCVRGLHRVRAFGVSFIHQIVTFFHVNAFGTIRDAVRATHARANVCARGVRARDLRLHVSEL